MRFAALLVCSLAHLARACFAQDVCAPQVASSTGPLTPAQINVILNAHNQLRRTVVPPAAVMPMLLWDANLAAQEQIEADKCLWEHVPWEVRIDSARWGYSVVGENLAAGSADAGFMMNLWAREVSSWSYNLYNLGCIGPGSCGHYTQMIWADTLRVGCGYSRCLNAIKYGTTTMSHLWRCAYGSAGNARNQYPYVLASGGNVAQCQIGTPSPTRVPSKAPTRTVTLQPSRSPRTSQPSRRPTTSRPSKRPTTTQPTKSPTTKSPSRSPIQAPTKRPTKAPSTLAPTKKPTLAPTKRPTKAPTFMPTKRPTVTPTKRPTKVPTIAVTKRPTKAPTRKPTKRPTVAPTKKPTKTPTSKPTKRPTKAPTVRPTKKPTSAPTKRPTTRSPTKKPTPLKPSKAPAPPTPSPTRQPIRAPTARSLCNDIKKKPACTKNNKCWWTSNKCRTRAFTPAPTALSTSSPTNQPVHAPTARSACNDIAKKAKCEENKKCWWTAQKCRTRAFTPAPTVRAG